MVKKLLATLLVCLLLTVPALADGSFDLEFLLNYAMQNPVVPGTDTEKPEPVSGAQVIDPEDQIDPLTERQIIAVIEEIEKKHQVDIVVLVTRDTPYDPSDSLYKVAGYADDYYDYGGYGMGPDFSGMLYLIDLRNRVQYISTGGVMMQYISDSREEKIYDAAELYLRRNDWGNAALSAVRKVSELMAKGRERGVFLYDEVTGQRLSGYYNPLEGFEVLLALGGGVLAAFIVCGTVTGSYGLKGSTYKYDLSGKSACTMTRDDEQFLRESVSRMARSSGSSGHGGVGGGRSGGSGVHRSSSGRSHGGGGRRF